MADGVIVDNGQPPDSRGREILDRRGADTACADQHDMRVEQPLLPRSADLLEDDMAGVAF